MSSVTPIVKGTLFRHSAAPAMPAGRAKKHDKPGAEHTCPGGKAHAAKHAKSHTRGPEVCRFLLDKSVDRRCLDWVEDVPWANPTPTLESDECKLAQT